MTGQREEYPPLGLAVDPTLRKVHSAEAGLVAAGVRSQKPGELAVAAATSERRAVTLEDVPPEAKYKNNEDDRANEKECSYEVSSAASGSAMSTEVVDKPPAAAPAQEDVIRHIDSAADLTMDDVASGSGLASQATSDDERSTAERMNSSLYSMASSFTEGTSASIATNSEEGHVSDSNVYSGRVVQFSQSQKAMLEKLYDINKSLRVLTSAKKTRTHKHRKIAEGSGVTIFKNHPSWELMLNVQTGLVYMVGRVAPMKNELRDHHFRESIKRWFPREGTKDTPAHASRSFKFKDHAPQVFYELRRMFGVDTSDYLNSIAGDKPLRELKTPGKSGAVFYLSHDEKYVIKTVSKPESRFLKSILRRYYEHTKQNPRSLLTKYFGLHRIKTPLGRRIRFVVMGNVFPEGMGIHERYDLKGSTYKRSASQAELAMFRVGKSVTLKDLNMDKKVVLGSTISDVFLSQIERDSQFLAENRIMDYSMLLGFHYAEREDLGTWETKDDMTMLGLMDRGNSSPFADANMPVPDISLSPRTSQALQGAIARGFFAEDDDNQQDEGERGDVQEDEEPCNTDDISEGAASGTKAVAVGERASISPMSQEPAESSTATEQGEESSALVSALAGANKEGKPAVIDRPAVSFGEDVGEVVREIDVDSETNDSESVSSHTNSHSEAESSSGRRGSLSDFWGKRPAGRRHTTKEYPSESPNRQSTGVRPSLALIKRRFSLDYGLMARKSGAQIDQERMRLVPQWFECEIESADGTRNKCVVCCGIIDILQQYNLRKFAEHKLKKFRKQIGHSVIQPEKYQRRFMDKMKTVFM